MFRLLAALLIPVLSFGAIAYDPGSFVDGGYVASGNLSWTHTYGGGSNGVAVVGVCVVPTAVPSVHTYNGVAMTLLASFAPLTGVCSTSGGGTLYFYIAYGPPMGASTVSITASQQIVGISATYTGVAQSGQPDAMSSGDGTCAASQTNMTYPCPAAITIGTANSWEFVMFGATGASVDVQPSPSLGGTWRGTGMFNAQYYWDSDGAAAAGSYTLNGGNNSISTPYSWLAISLKPAGAPVGNPVSQGGIF